MLAYTLNIGKYIRNFIHDLRRKHFLEKEFSVIP